MQRVLFAALFSTALLLAGASANAQTHHYVKHHPEERTMTHPNAPSSHHVWVNSEWKWHDGKYEESAGHWAVPPRGHHEWTAGRWEKNSRGDYWVPGHWH